MRDPAYNRERCPYCDRVLTRRDFARGVAVCDFEHTFDGPAERPAHVNACEGVPLRVLRGVRHA